MKAAPAPIRAAWMRRKARRLHGAIARLTRLWSPRIEPKAPLIDLDMRRRRP
jgi:hypothetical protein